MTTVLKTVINMFGFNSLFIVELLIFVTIIDITNQTDCGTQMLIWSDNAENMMANWQFNYDNSDPAHMTLSTDAGYYYMQLRDYDPEVTTPNFVTNQIISTAAYTDIQIKYAIKQTAHKRGLMSGPPMPTDTAQCGMSYSVDDGVSFTEIDMRSSVVVDQGKWIQISANLGTDAQHRNNIKLRWEMTSFDTDVSFFFVHQKCYIDEIKLCGTLSGTLEPSNSPTSQTVSPSKAPSLPTTSPSKSPTEPPIEPCKVGVGYYIEGIPAIATGDPHFTTWDGDRHDFMGIGDNSQQFYYIHPCQGKTRRQMPFTLLGTHLQVWGSVTSLHYVTLELFDFNGDEYLIWLNSFINSWIQREPTTSTLYDGNNQAEYQHLISGQEINIGSRFRVSYNQVDLLRINFILTVVGNNFGECNLQFSMERQINWLSPGSRIHMITVIPPPCYKCYICGLFGDFQSNSPNNMQKCDGGNFPYRSGSKLATTPEAYDENAWTWEKTYVKNNCPINANRRRGLQNSEYSITIPNGFEYVDPCDPTIAQQIENTCQLVRNEQSECCNIIGNEICNKLQKFCDYDVCVTVSGNVTEFNINRQIIQLLVRPIQLLCTLPGSDVLFDLSNLVEIPPITPSPTDDNKSSDDDENDSDTESSDVLFSGMDIISGVVDNNMEDKHHHTDIVKVQLTDSVYLCVVMLCICLVIVCLCVS